MKKEMIMGIVGIEKRRLREDYKSGISEEEIAQILSHTKIIKHRILIELIYECSLSLEDVLSLKYSDIDLINGELMINNNRIIMPLRLVNLLRDYFSCEKLGNYILETSHGRMNKNAAEKIIETIALQAINKPINSDDIRVSSINHKIFENRDLLLESKQENCLPISYSYGRQFPY